MKKIIGLTVAAMMVMGLVGGGTWAYFSDTETATGNYLSTGTLDLSLSGTAPFALSEVLPGDSAESAVDWTLTQSGSITGNLSVSIGTITNGENTIWDPESDQSDTSDDPDGGELGSKVKIAMWLDDDDNGWDTGDFYLVAGGTITNYSSGSTVPTAAYDYIDNFENDSWSNIDQLSGSGSTHFKIGYIFPDSGDATDNIAQSDNVTFDFTFTLRQE